MTVFSQPPLFQRPGTWSPPAIGSLPSWQGAKRVAVDVETRDDDLKRLGPGVRRGAYIVGVSFAIEDGPAFYLPMRHAIGRNLDEVQVLAYLRTQAAAFAGDLCGANLSYDLDFLAEVNVEFPVVRFFRDTQVAEPLLDENQLHYSLAAIAERRGLPGKSEEELRAAAAEWGVDPKAGLWQLPPEAVGKYAEQDARLPLLLLRRQEREIEAQDLWRVYDLESRLLPILVRMRRRGVRIDVDRLAAVERWAKEREYAALTEIKATTGVEVDVWKSNTVAAALTAIGVNVPKTETGRDSTRAGLLEAIDHDVARALLRARRANKLRTTFCESIRDHMTNGRIHCIFNQLRTQKDDGDLFGAAYGRMSCTQPCLQQIPTRDEEIGPMIRSVFLPDDGKLWASVDAASQEPRLMVHFANLCQCRGAADFVKKYHENPRLDLHGEVAKLAGIVRKQAKTIGLGIAYGMGRAKLCRSLGLSEEAGYDLLERFDRMVPFIRSLSRIAESRAKACGFVRTLSGRRCRFPTKDGTMLWIHKALNRIIQGSAADQIKQAMVDADAAGFALQLQVHDELDLSVASREEAEALGRIIENAVPLSIPVCTDVEIGPDWGNLK